MAARAALPTGVITCVFTDIEGSTRLLRELGAGYDELLATHRRTLRAVWAAHAGHEVSTGGDGFFVVFERAVDALQAAVAVQRAVAATRWPTALPVRVRIGIHTGFARPVDGDYSALAVHQASRIVDAAHGGQVLASGETAAAASEQAGAPVLTALGRFRVRDFTAPVELFAVTAAGVAPESAAPRVRPADGHNLVRPSTSLIGRAEEIGRLAERVRPGTITTIVGPGGVGKTRVAVETALAVAGRWADGAWFVDLAPLAAPELVADAVGDAVGAPSAPGAERWQLVCEHLAQREALVLLDNCEHLASAAALVAGELVTACPFVAVLATSRSPLGLRAERVVRLRPLSTRRRDGPAVALFLDRAGEQGAGDTDDVATLCSELDGLPLAIELAAARTTAVTPAELLRRLREATPVLRSRDPTLPERHRTLERLLDWSYDLLAADARAVLRRLTAFAGDFDLQAAQVAGAAGDLELGDVAEHLWWLVDSSLVVAEDAAGASRYRLLATVRSYAAERTGTEERAGAVLRLAHRYLERVGPERPAGRAWLGEMATELANVRGVAGAVDDPALAQALAWSVGRYHDVTDAFRTGTRELARWVERLPDPTPERVALLTLLADLHTRVADLDAAERLLTEAETLSRRVGVAPWDGAGLARTRGDLALRRGQPAVAAGVARQALAGSQRPWGRARLFNLLGIALCELGDPAGGVQAFAQELAAASVAGVETYVPTAHANLAESSLRIGDEVQAAHHQQQALDLAREQRQPVIVGFGLMVAARMAADHGDARGAVVLQAAADGLLAAAAYALYAEDRRMRDELALATRETLGERRYAQAAAEGAELGLDAAAALASAVFAGVRSSLPDPRVTR